MAELPQQNPAWTVRPVTRYEVIREDHRRPSEVCESEALAIRFAKAFANTPDSRILILNAAGKVKEEL